MFGIAFAFPLRRLQGDALTLLGKDKMAVESFFPQVLSVENGGMLRGICAEPMLKSIRYRWMISTIIVSNQRHFLKRRECRNRRNNGTFRRKEEKERQRLLSLLLWGLRRFIFRGSA